MLSSDFTCLKCVIFLKFIGLLRLILYPLHYLFSNKEEKQLKYNVVVVCLMVFNVTFNNISLISSWSVYWWKKPEDPEKATDLSQ